MCEAAAQAGGFTASTLWILPFTTPGFTTASESDKEIKYTQGSSERSVNSVFWRKQMLLQPPPTQSRVWEAGVGDPALLAGSRGDTKPDVPHAAGRGVCARTAGLTSLPFHS